MRALAGLCLLAACAAPPRPAEPVWRAIAAPTTASLRAIAVGVDGGGVVWVGGAGALWRSDDGGATWRDVRPRDAEQLDFRDVAAFGSDAALAMVAGQPARVYRTDDGGRSWRVVLADPRPAAFFDALAFAGDTGVLFGDPVDGAFAVWCTRDAGRTWTALGPGQVPAPLSGEAGFAASGTCAAVRADGERAWIVTGGETSRCLTVALAGAPPRAVALPLAAGAPSQGAFAVAGRGDRLVAVGGDYRDPARAAGTAAWSDDGGATWHAAVPGAGGYRSAVVWLDDERLLAVGADGASRSDDGGRTWRPFGDVGFHAAAVAPDGLVWLCGSDGRIAVWRPDGRAPTAAAPLDREIGAPRGSAGARLSPTHGRNPPARVVRAGNCR